MDPSDGVDPRNQSAKGKEIAVMMKNQNEFPTSDLILQESEFDSTARICSPVKEDCGLDTDEELEMECMKATLKDQGTACKSDSLVHSLEADSSVGSSSYKSNQVDNFVSMGFAEKMVIRAIKENDGGNDEEILNHLLTYSVLDDVPGSPKSSEDSFYNLSDEDSGAVTSVKGNGSDSNKKDATISVLVDMGYEAGVVSTAIDRCGRDAPIDVLIDFISAAEAVELPAATNFQFQTPIQTAQNQIVKKRKVVQEDSERHRKWPDGREESSSRKQMIGFGVPGCIPVVSNRKIPDDVVGPPYFYYENVALTPKGVWEQISRFLYDIEPEFVDSIHFSAAARKRGYIHNLPLEGRQRLLPIPPKTIQEAMPDTAMWWPAWDKRTKLNCLLTCIGSAQLTKKIRKRLQSGEPSEFDKKWVIEQCKKWNLVWVGKNKAAVLEPDDMELLLGFPRNHTRGLGRTDRYKSLGNSFQIDTVAYHLSVLKPLYPNGMNVLSLFSGIGGAELALHRIGIAMKNVVSVEMSPVSRKVLQDWWEETGLTGKLIHVNDVQQVSCQMIDRWIEEFGGFDLVIGGSPCNNLAGGNRRTRDGLTGEHSSLFFEYQRIVDYVRFSMKRRS